MQDEWTAVGNRIAAYSVGLVNTTMVAMNGRYQSESIGTATAIRGRDRLFLLTAKHNLDDAGASEFEFMPKTTAAAVFGNSGDPIDPLNVFPRCRIPVVEIIRCDHEDLAILLIDEKFEEGKGPSRHMEFFPWRSDLVSPPVGGVVTALGHPSDRTYVVADRRRGNSVDREMGVLKYFISCEVVSDEKGRNIKDYDPAKHFLVDYSGISNKHQPHGFSGCAWWQHEDHRNDIWVANPVFAGVETSFVRSGQLLVNIRPEVVSEWVTAVGM
jgi:hypothetical protein